MTIETIENLTEALEVCDERGYHHTDAVCERLSLIASVLICVLAELNRSNVSNEYRGKSDEQA